MNPRPHATNPRNRRAARLVALALGAGLLLGSLDASAARLGGGRSSGLYRPQITRSTPVSPARADARTQTAPKADARATTSAATAGAPRRNSWLGPLAGLAAGLGLGALLAHLGMAPALGSWLLLALLALGGFALLRALTRAPRARSALATGTPWQTPGEASPRQDWNGVGAPAAAQGAGDGFDSETFIGRARDVFVQLQQANDRGDLDALQDATTPELFEQLQRDLIRRGSAAQNTRVLSLQADMLEHVEHPRAELVSVRFSGLLQEQPQAGGAESFDEVWHFSRPRDRSTGWLLAGIQPTA